MYRQQHLIHEIDSLCIYQISILKVFVLFHLIILISLILFLCYVVNFIF